MSVDECATPAAARDEIRHTFGPSEFAGTTIVGYDFIPTVSQRRRGEAERQRETLENAAALRGPRSDCL